MDRILKRSTSEAGLEGSSKEVTRFTVCDGDTDKELCHGDVEIDRLLDLMTGETKFMWLQMEGMLRPLLSFSVQRVFVEEELKPIIGYFDVELIHSKLFAGGFHQTIRTVTKYGDEVHGVHTCFGTLNPKYNGLAFYIPGRVLNAPYVT